MGSPGPAGHCGGCGYDVRGLPSRICPECGSDLDRVGVHYGETASPYRRLAYSAVVLVVFAFLCVAGAAVSVPIAERIWPPHIRIIESDTSLLHPRSGAYFGIRIEIRQMYAGSRQSGELTVTFLRDRGESLESALRAKAVWSDSAPLHVPRADFDAWVRSHGLDASSDQLDAEMDRAYQLMRIYLGDYTVVSVGDHQAFGDTVRTQRSWHRAPNHLPRMGIRLGWAVILAVGSIILARRVDSYFTRA